MERCFYVSPPPMTFSYYVHDNGYYGVAMLPVSETKKQEKIKVMKMKKKNS